MNFDKAEASSGVHFSLAKEETLVSFPLRSIGGSKVRGLMKQTRRIVKPVFFPHRSFRNCAGCDRETTLYPARFPPRIRLLSRPNEAQAMYLFLSCMTL